MCVRIKIQCRKKRRNADIDTVQAATAASTLDSFPSRRSLVCFIYFLVHSAFRTAFPINFTRIFLLFTPIAYLPMNFVVYVD